MKNGKHAAPRGMKRSLVLVVSLLALLLAVAGGTLAWLTAQDSVSNTFTPAHVTCNVEESFNGTAKSDVKIKNTSDIPVYIRASIIVTWKDPSGNVYGQLPVADTDYTIGYGTGWTRQGDYWYCNSEVAVGANTPELISSCTEVAGKAPKENYRLSVEIIAEAIQSQPDRAVQQAWGVTISGGNVTAYSGN